MTHLHDNNNSYYTFTITIIIPLSCTVISVHIERLSSSYLGRFTFHLRDIAIQMCATDYGVTSPRESPLRTPFSVVKRNESDGPLSRFPTKTIRFRPQLQATALAGHLSR